MKYCNVLVLVFEWDEAVSNAPVVLHVIVHIDHNVVAPISLDGGPGILICALSVTCPKCRLNDRPLMSMAGFRTPSGPSQFVTFVMCRST